MLHVLEFNSELWKPLGWVSLKIGHMPSVPTAQNLAVVIVAAARSDRLISSEYNCGSIQHYYEVFLHEKNGWSNAELWFFAQCTL